MPRCSSTFSNAAWLQPTRRPDSLELFDRTDRPCGRKRFIDALQLGSKSPIGLSEAERHAGPLGALTGEHEAHRRRVRGYAGVPRAVRDPRQLIDQCRCIGCDERCAMLQVVRASACCCTCDGARILASTQQLGVCGGKPAHGLIAPRGQREKVRRGR
jgi:hypothetical protein